MRKDFMNEAVINFSEGVMQ